MKNNPEIGSWVWSIAILRQFHNEGDIWRNTSVPWSPDRWHVPVRACPQLWGAVAQQSTRLLSHFRDHQNYMTNMLRFSQAQENMLLWPIFIMCWKIKKNAWGTSNICDWNLKNTRTLHFWRNSALNVQAMLHKNRFGTNRFLQFRP